MCQSVPFTNVEVIFVHKQLHIRNKGMFEASPQCVAETGDRSSSKERQRKRKRKIIDSDTHESTHNGNLSTSSNFNN